MNPAYPKLQTIAAPIDDALFAKLNLDRIPCAGSIDPAQADAERGQMDAGLLNAALNLSVANFPLLKLEEWMLFLDAAQYALRPDRWVMWNHALQPRKHSFLLNELYQSHGKKTLEGLDLQRLEKIGPNETFSILLVADRFWTEQTNGWIGLREILSAVSRRPKESVFFDDPSIEDLWKVAKIEFSSETDGKVTFTYADQEMATLAFRLSGDKNTVTFGKLTCEETRPLVSPGEYLQDVLSSIAATGVFAAVS